MKTWIRLALFAIAVLGFLGFLGFSQASSAQGIGGGINNPGAPQNAAITANGQTCTLGLTCNINSGAAVHSVAINEGAGSAISGIACGVGTILQGASAADPTCTATPALGTDNSVAGTLQLSNGSASAHTIFSSGATTTNTIAGFAVVPTTGHMVTCTVSGTTCTLTDGGAPGGSGTVTSFSAGTLSPIFSTSVATATTTPALTFTLTNAAAGTVLGNATGSAAGPTYTSTPVLGVSGTAGTLGLFPASGNFTTTLGSAATASNTVNFFAAAPVTNHLISCVVASTTCTLTDSGVLASSVMTNPMTTLGDIIYENATPVPARLAGCVIAVSVPCTLVSTPTSGPTAAAPAWLLAGVPVDATNPATLLNTDRANYIKWTSGTALALPAVSGAFASNMPFVIQNTSTTLTITPNAGASDLIDGAATGTIIPNFAAFVYQDGTSAPGHWFTIKYPTFAAFPACADSAGNHINFSTTTGFSCGTTSSGGAGIGYGAGAGSVNVMTVTTVPAIATNAAGTIVEVLPNLANTTTTPTLNVGGAGAQTIVKGPANSALIAGDYNTTQNAIFMSNGSQWQLLNPQAAVSYSGTTAGFYDLVQGTTSSAVASCNAATSICHQAPTSVTSYLVTEPGAAPGAASYEQTDACAAAACTMSFHHVPVLLTVTGDFTDSTSTTLQLITGLSHTMPTSQAAVVSFHCAILFDQGTSAVADAFGIGITGTAPTQANASGSAFPSTSTITTGTLVALASTTPTAVVTFTPSAITTVWRVVLDGTVEQPSNATPGVLGFYVSTTTGTDNVIVKRGSYCSLIYQ